MRNKQQGGAFKFDKLEFFSFSEVWVLANSRTLQTRGLCHMKPTETCVLCVQLNFDLK